MIYSNGFNNKLNILNVCNVRTLITLIFIEQDPNLSSVRGMNGV